jgi:hypothetical protein
MGNILEDIKISSEWIAKALQSSGYATDFTPNSLWEIERFFEDHCENGQAKTGGLLSQNSGSRLFAVGAYVGEVIRRDQGGEWLGNDDDPQAEINVSLRIGDGSVIWPIQRVIKRFREGESESITAYGLALGLRIGEKPKPKSALSKAS